MRQINQPYSEGSRGPLGLVMVMGAGGLLGSRLGLYLADIATTVVSTVRSPRPGCMVVDVRKRDSVRDAILDVRPSVVFLAAALADVDACERCPTESEAVNARAPGLVAESCWLIGARLVHFSTDYVFDGTSGPYHEGDLPRPVNRYGADKLAGEKAVLASNPLSLVVRTSQIYDGPECPGGFVKHLLADAVAGRQTRASDNQFNTPTHVRDLIEGCLSLLHGGIYGVVHLAGPETISRGEAVRRAITTLPITGARWAAADAAFLTVARRPARCGLRIDLAQHLVGYDPGSINNRLTNASWCAMS